MHIPPIEMNSTPLTPEDIDRAQRQLSEYLETVVAFEEASREAIKHSTLRF